MLSEKDKANQREFQRKVRELYNLLHDMGGTRRDARQFASPELAHSWTRLREATHWMREHMHANIMAKDKQAKED